MTLGLCFSLWSGFRGWNLPDTTVRLTPGTRLLGTGIGGIFQGPGSSLSSFLALGFEIHQQGLISVSWLCVNLRVPRFLSGMFHTPCGRKSVK